MKSGSIIIIWNLRILLDLVWDLQFLNIFCLMDYVKEKTNHEIPKAMIALISKTSWCSLNK